MPKSHNRSGNTRIDITTTQISRRHVVAAGTALLGAAVMPGKVAGAADTGLGSAADLLAAVRAFLAKLEPEKRKLASFAWNGPEWRGWNYFGAAGFIKPGLRDRKSVV